MDRAYSVHLQEERVTRQLYIHEIMMITQSEKKTCLSECEKRKVPRMRWQHAKHLLPIENNRNKILLSAKLFVWSAIVDMHVQHIYTENGEGGVHCHKNRINN